MVDAAADEGRDLPRVLDVFTRRGWQTYFGGVGLERVTPQLAAYRALPVCRDPLVARLAPTTRF